MAAADPAREIAESCLGMRARLVSRVVSGLYDDALRPFGIRISQMNILVATARLGPVTAATVAERLCMDKSTLSRNVARMREQGWLVGGPQLEISAKGSRLLARLAPAWRDVQARVEDVLGTQGSKALTRLARRASRASTP